MKKTLILLLLFIVSCISVDETKKDNDNFYKNKKSNNSFNNKNSKNKNLNDKKDVVKISNNGELLLNNLECNQRNDVVEHALSFDKIASVPKPGVNDCSGFVKFVFGYFNVDIFNITTESNSGTEIIYNYSKENGKVFTENKTPKKGDFIFFDNSYDRNDDGKVNDHFTHIAIVTNVDSDGTVEYIHKSGSGINVQYMNLKDKENQYSEDKKRINSYLRKKTKNDEGNTPYLSGQMFKSYGTIFSDNCNNISVTTGFNPSKEAKDSNDVKDEVITTGFNPSKDDKKHTKDESTTKKKDNFSFKNKNTVELEVDTKKESNDEKDKSVKTGFNPSKEKKESNDEKDEVIKTGFNPSKEKREKIIQFAKKTNSTDLTKNKFKNNSSGFIAYIYKKVLNIDILNDKNITKKNKKGEELNGVEIINNYINKYGIIYRNTDIQEGDLVFFDNTFEENRNGKLTNYTLIGIVVDVDENETVTFLYNSDGKIQTGKLNKKFPKQQFSTEDKKEINSFLRKKANSDKKGTKYLSGEFYRSFGTVFKKH